MITLGQALKMAKNGEFDGSVLQCCTVKEFASAVEQLRKAGWDFLNSDGAVHTYIKYKNGVCYHYYLIY